MTALYVNEIFGPTLQGEGPSLGRPCAFIRTAGCNLACSWCDTPYTWDWTRFDRAEETQKLTPDQLAAAVLPLLPPVPLLVVSGGEPMLQQPALTLGLLAIKMAAGFEVDVEVETAGTIAPRPEFAQLVHRFNVSPKLEHSGNPLNKRTRPEAIAAIRDTGRAVFKFVAGDPTDLDEIAVFVNTFHVDPAQVYVMPLGTRRMELMYRLHQLAAPVIARGWHLTPRLQIDIWGNTRGH